jgi:hypothetical protein
LTVFPQNRGVTPLNLFPKYTDEMPDFNDETAKSNYLIKV